MIVALEDFQPNSAFDYIIEKSIYLLYPERFPF